jgi:hypothetical protein
MQPEVKWFVSGVVFAAVCGLPPLLLVFQRVMQEAVAAATLEARASCWSFSGNLNRPNPSVPSPLLQLHQSQQLHCPVCPAAGKCKATAVDEHAQGGSPISAFEGGGSSNAVIAALDAGTRSKPPAPVVAGAAKEAELLLAAQTSAEIGDLACVAGAIDPAIARSIGLNKHLRVWVDPGPRACEVPENFDVGLCVPNEEAAVVGGEYRCIPNFFILAPVGVGSKALTRYLTMHPRMAAESQVWDGPTDAIAVPAVWPTRQNWREYLKGFAPISPIDIAKVVTFGKRVAKGATEHNLYHRMPPQKIIALNKLLPSLRLLVMLRDPGERLYTWFRQVCEAGNLLQNSQTGIFQCLHDNDAQQPFVRAAGKGGLEGFERTTICTDAEFERMVVSEAGKRESTIDATGDNQSTLSCVEQAFADGKYVEWLVPWREVYAPDQMRVIFATDIFSQNITQEMRAIETHNRIGHFRWDRLMHDTVRGTKDIRMPGRRVGGGMGGGEDEQRILSPLPPPMTQVTQQMLLKYYTPSNAKLQDLLGLTMLPGFKAIDSG